MRAVVVGLLLAGLAGPFARAQDLGQGVAPPAPAPVPAVTLTRPPVVVKAVEPVYPPEALAARAAADVTMVVDLDAAGRVTAVAVARPVGHGFDEAAQAAMLRYQFSPAEVDGKPAPIRTEYTLHFLPGTAAPAPDPDPAVR